MRIPSSEHAFAQWVQSVEDRLKSLRRGIHPQENSIGALSADTLRAGRIQVGTDASALITPLGGGAIQVGQILAAPRLSTSITPAVTLGTVIGRVELCDETGTVVGYLPVYDLIS